MSIKFSSFIATSVTAFGLVMGSVSIATAADATTQTATTTTKQSKGTTDLSTALARTELSKLGITNPTPAQLDAALKGGTVIGSDGKPVTLQGVTTQRESGMGWGQIANAMGVKLGAVISAAKSAAKQDTADGEQVDQEGNALKKNMHASSGGSGHGGDKGGKGGNGGGGGGGNGGGNGGSKK